MLVYKFPEGFYWGASTSSHQVEGGNYNNWSEWEKSQRRINHLKEQGKIEQLGMENFLSGKAAGHYDLYKEDYELAKKLGHNAARFSIEWSRIEPEEGKFDEKALQKYLDILSFLRELKIEPFVTLWHWTLPVWIADIGGWENPKTVEYFVRYAQKTAEYLEGKVDVWITINEPEIFSTFSYYKGIWPPQKKSLFSYLKVLNNLIRAHKKSYIILKQFPNCEVGIAKNNIYYEAQKNILDESLVKIYRWWWNFYFLNRVAKFQDFIGLNFYFRNKIKWGKVANENLKTSDIGWELFPEGIYHVLKELKKYKKPIYITENGLADANDKHRAEFIVESLKFVHKAIEHGVDVKAYLHWSLIDNFEWDSGFAPRFGLVEVEYSTLKRKPRDSAFIYKDIAQNNGISKDILQKIKKQPQ